MKVRIDGGRTVALRTEDFVAAGGEGRVWAVGGTAIKIYDDAARALSADKLAELQRIVDPAAVVPHALVRDGRGRIVGHAMRHVPHAWALAQLVPTAFWQRHGLDATAATAIVGRLADAVRAVHAAGCVVVDLNDTNVLVEPGSRQPALIDADSWQTPHHPATAATPGFVDPHARSFDPGTDWYSFGILAFALLIGLHPFKGKHPRVHGLAERMRAGITALDPAVRRPASCRPLSTIPPAWQAWLHDVLGGRDRRPPPPVLAAIPTARASTSANAAGRRCGDLVLHLDTRTHRLGVSATGPVIPAVLPVVVRSLEIVGGTAYVLTDSALLALDPCRVGARTIVGLRHVMDVLPHASRLWPGVLLQDVLGTPHATVLRDGTTHGFGLPALARTQILAASAQGDVVSLAVRRGHDDEHWRYTPDPARPGSAIGTRVTPGAAAIGPLATAGPGARTQRNAVQGLAPGK